MSREAEPVQGVPLRAQKLRARGSGTFGFCQDKSSSSSEGSGSGSSSGSGSGSYRPSSPVHRYAVSLSAFTGSFESRPGSPAKGRGPTAQLEVRVGRLYPLETPRLRLREVDGLSKEAQKELNR